MEVIIYGSSRAMRHIDVMEMYNQYGIGAFNYGSTWIHLNTCLVYLADSFKTQHPKVAVIETSLIGDPLPEKNQEGEILVTSALASSVEKFRFIRQCFGYDVMRYVTYCFPFILFHNNWTDINEDSFHSPTEEYLKETMGFRDLDDGEEATIQSITVPSYEKTEQWEIPAPDKELLDRMVSLCRKNGVEIVFYTSPVQEKYHYTNAMELYALRNSAHYIDGYRELEEIGIDPTADFMNKGHLNRNGAEKLGNYIGKYLYENFSLTDMRTITPNLWEEDKIEVVFDE